MVKARTEMSNPMTGDVTSIVDTSKKEHVAFNE